MFTSLLVSSSTSRRAHSQTPAATTAKPEAVIVVTGTRTPEQVERATVRTDVVTRQEAERRAATNVAEALSSEPGVQVNPGAYGYLGNVSPIQIQGFDLGRVLILEDGEPVIGDVGGAIDLAAIPINDVERIEIVAGPTSALYGSSALGGVVNVITGPPDREGPSARAGAEYRSHHGLVLRGAGAYRAQRTWAELDLSRTRQDGVAEVSGLPDLQIPNSARSLVGARVGVGLGPNIDLRVRLRWLHQRFDGLESQDFPGLGRYLSDLPQTTDRLALHVQEQIRLGRGSSLRFSLARQWVASESGNRPRSSPLAQSHESAQSMHSFEATATLADGARTWVLCARFEAQRLSQQFHQTERVAGLLVDRTTTEVVPQGLSNAAVYGQLGWKFGRALTLLPGARVEYHGRYGNVVAPRLAVAFRARDSITLRAAVGRGFRTPSAEELGFNFDHSVYGYKVLGNPRLEPERSWGLNGDVAWHPAPAIALHAGAFSNWVNDLIAIDLAGGSRSGTVVTYSYKNFQQVRTFGVNVGSGVRFGTRSRLDLAYDYLWTRDLLEDEPLTGRPPHTGTAAVQLGLPAELELYVRAHVVSDAFVDATTRTPGYETVDLRLGRALWPGSFAYAGVLNLCDVRQDPTRIGDLRPPLGRVLYLGLRASLPDEEP